MPSTGGPILIAYDGSDNAKHAIAVAGAVLAAHPALVATIWESVWTMAYRHPMPGDFGITQDVVEEIDSVRSRPPRRPPGRASGSRAKRVSPPSPSRTAATTASTRRSSTSHHDRAAHVVVVGTRGRSRVRTMLLGSVSYGVVHHCRRPVLTVPPEE
jgi:nucleotide-binding universal stress UspA family protein